MSQPKNSKASLTPPGKNCLDDSVLLAIAQGRLAEPALGHYLAHLENCLACCERSDWLGRKNPSGITALLDGFAQAEKQHPPDRLTPKIQEYPWQKKLQGLGPKLPSPALDQASPDGHTMFGPWEILGVLGEGRAAVVYKARDSRLGRDVALKVLRPDVAAIPGMAGSFLGEAKAMAQVRDPHLVVLYSHGNSPLPFLEMELLEGQTLAQALKKGPLEPARALKITREVAQGLAALHARGLVHRDLKPANIWLQTIRGQEQSILMDLGLVAFGATRSGTPGYMAPELLTGTAQNAQPTSDIFSLGALLRAMALGGDSLAKSREKPPAELAPLIQTLMADLPEKRPSANMVIALIQDILVRRKHRSRRIFMATAAGALGLGGLGLWALVRDKDKPEPAKASLPSAPKGPGIPPKRILDNAFSPQATNLQVGMHLCQGQAFLLNPLKLNRFDINKGITESISTPFLVERHSFAGNLCAMANSGGKIEIWNISQWPPQKMQSYELPREMGSHLLSISLAPNHSGTLLVALREMLFTASPDQQGYPDNLTPHDEARLFANQLQPLSMGLDETGQQVLGFHGRGGVTLHELGPKHKQIWAFRPFIQGPAIYALRPGHPGEVALASPLGDINLYGPEINRPVDGNPYPREAWFRKFPGYVLDLEFLDGNLLVAQTNLAPCPLKYTHAHLGGQVWHDLSCESPVCIASDKDEGLLYCLDIQGRLHVWQGSDLALPE